MILSCQREIILEESDRLIRDDELQVRLKNLTLKSIRELLQPQKILDKYRELAPCTWDLLFTFTASPNKYRKRKVEVPGDNNEVEGDDWDDDPNLADDAPEKNWKGIPMPESFARNPMLVSFLIVLH
jgi:hypothetical protein